MALTDSQVRALRRRVRAGALEVEHLLKVASAGDPADAPILRRLALDFEFPRGSGGAGHPVPLGTWTDVACVFLEQGYPGLERLCDTRRLLPFCLGLLEELHTAPCLEVLNRLAAGCSMRADRLRVASTVNLVCSFQPPPDIPAEARAAARAWLHDLLEEVVQPDARAIAVCALRGVGDSVSLKKIAELPPFPHPWEGLEKSATRAIKRRLRRQAG